MNETIKANYLKTFLFTSTAFGLPIGLLFALINSLNEALILGLIAGIFFGGIITLFVAAMDKRTSKIQKKLLGDTPVILRGNANHLVGPEAVGGWLFLTTDALCFKSHGMNVQNHSTEILLSEIKSVEPFNNLGFIPNGIRIITANGNESFVINGRGRWVREISARSK